MPTTMNPITGGCLCGEVRYQCTAPPDHSTFCHCATCRRASGSHVLGWVTFAKSSFQFTSNPPAEFRSSKSVLRTFCPICGTPLTYRHEKSPDEIDVTIGSLDAPDNTSPADHIWMSDALAWDKPADGLPQFKSERYQ
ncbi:MAG: GFA family protein [Steroidobacteraceae bacterium]